MTRKSRLRLLLSLATLLTLDAGANASFLISSSNRSVTSSAFGQDSSGPVTNSQDRFTTDGGYWVQGAGSPVIFGSIGCYPVAVQESLVSASSLRGTGHADANASIADPDAESASSSSSNNATINFQVSETEQYILSASVSFSDIGGATFNLIENGSSLIALFGIDSISNESIRLFAGRSYSLQVSSGASAFVGSGNQQTFSSGSGDWGFSLRPAAVPEPQSWIAIGAAGVLAFGLRRRF